MGRDLGPFGIDVRIILKWILNMVLSIHLIRTEPWRVLVNMVMNQSSHMSQEISGVAKLI